MTTLPTAVDLLERGYALWIGAGATAHLALAGGGSVPQWSELVGAMEVAANLPVPGGTYGARLEVCLRALGRDAFQRQLRRLLLDPLLRAVRDAANTETQQGGLVPRAARQLAALGQLANPIVSFNIEAETSSLVGGCAGTYRLLPFRAPIPDSVSDLQLHSFGNTGRPEPARLIYHPHGVLDLTGICVLTDTDYEAMNGTLALQLAIHAAFQRTLAIVGMSLDDEYLREQLRRFRPHTGGVIWFVRGRPTPEKEAWAARAGVEVVDVGSWPEFWTAIEDRFGALLDAPRLACAWSGRFEKAWQAVQGWRQLGHQARSARAAGQPPEQVLRWTRLALLAGEPYSDPAAQMQTTAPTADDVRTLGALNAACRP